MVSHKKTTSTTSKSGARYLTKVVVSDALADGKMAFISGPRQVGKTTMGRSLLIEDQNYLSWDHADTRKLWSGAPSDLLKEIGRGPILFDEIHKDRKWKSRLKGIYDTYGDELEILVTGSARLDLYRKGSDSLLGRYIPYRLHPFSIAETDSPIGPDEILHSQKASYSWDALMSYGGFPEPLFAANENKANRWSRLRLDRLAYEDSRDIKVISNLNAFRTLIDLIPSKVGGLFSYNSLREDVGVAYATVRDWVLLSEMLYYGFFIRPYSKGLARSLRAEPKFFLFDILQIPKSEKSKRLENLAALHLLKACHYWTDIGEGVFELQFVRDKEKREVDFLITRDRKPWILIECKSNSKSPSKNLLYFSEKLKTPLNFQLVTDHGYDREHPVVNTRVMSYEKFFAGWL